MTTPGPSAGRGQPAFDAPAQDAIAAARGQRRRHGALPEWEQALGYERAELTPEERAEAAKVAAEEARVCRYCLAVHKFPTSIGCPRIAEADLAADGRVTRVRFREDAKWTQRVALVEDLAESEGDDDK